MKSGFILFSLMFLMFACGLPEKKKLNQESGKVLDSIVNELKLEDFNYSYHTKTSQGHTTKVFFVDLSDIDDSTDFKPYNNRIISAFEKSGFDFSNIDYIRIEYFRKLVPVDLYVFYDIDPHSKRIMNEGKQ